MLRLTTRIDYGVRALVRLGEIGQGNVLTAAEISQKEGIPIQFLEQILVTLRRSGLIRSVRGPGGGYTLSKPASQLTLKEIFDVLEGSTALIRCLDPLSLEHCEREGSCTARLLFQKMQDQLDTLLKETSLEDLILMGQEAGALS